MKNAIRSLACACVVFVAAGARGDSYFCEYMDTPANQPTYVDTGYFPCAATVIRFKGAFLNLLSYGRLFENFIDETTPVVRCILTDAPATHSLYLAVHSQAQCNMYVENAFASAGDPIEGVVAQGYNALRGFDVFDERGTAGYVNYEKLSPKTLALHSTKNASPSHSTRLWYLQIYEGGHLVRSFLPYVKDGVPGYFDTCRRTFHPATTGTLTPGPRANLLEVVCEYPVPDAAAFLGQDGCAPWAGVHVVSADPTDYAAATITLDNRGYSPEATLEHSMEGLTTLIWRWKLDRGHVYSPPRKYKGDYVEYVDGYKGACVDTHFAMNTNHEYRFDAEILSTPSAEWTQIWGVPAETTQLKTAFGIGGFTSSRAMSFWHSSVYTGGATLAYVYKDGYRCRYRGWVNYDRFAVTNVTKSVSAADSIQHTSGEANDETVRIFSARHNTVAPDHAVRFYSFEIYDRVQQKTLLDLKPYVKASGEVGFVDTVTGAFFGNANAALLSSKLAPGPVIRRDMKE